MKFLFEVYLLDGDFEFYTSIILVENVLDSCCLSYSMKSLASFNVQRTTLFIPH